MFEYNWPQARLMARDFRRLTGKYLINAPDPCPYYPCFFVEEGFTGGSELGETNRMPYINEETKRELGIDKKTLDKTDRAERICSACSGSGPTRCVLREGQLNLPFVQEVLGRKEIALIV